MADVVLSEEERELALAETQVVVLAAADEIFRGELAELVAAISEGALGDPEARTLERVLELALQAGRIRAVYGPGGEQTALRLFRRLPAGAALRESAVEV